MVALDASYHTNCLSTLYNRHNSLMRSNKMTGNFGMTNRAEGIASAELVSFIESERIDNIAPVFKLSELVKLYMSCLKELGIKIEGRVNSTRLKQRLLSITSGLKSQAQGKEIVFIFEADIGGAIKNACVNDRDSNYYEITCPDKAEAETRVILHVLHSVCQGFVNICVRTVDTDVVVLSVASMNEETMEGSKCKLEQLCLAFATVAKIIFPNHLQIC